MGDSHESRLSSILNERLDGVDGVDGDSGEGVDESEEALDGDEFLLKSIQGEKTSTASSALDLFQESVDVVDSASPGDGEGLVSGDAAGDDDSELVLDANQGVLQLGNILLGRAGAHDGLDVLDGLVELVNDDCERGHSDEGLEDDGARDDGREGSAGQGEGGEDSRELHFGG